MRVDLRERAREDVIELVHRGLDTRELSLAAGRVLQRAVPFDGVCVLTFDPATLMPTGEVVENGLPAEAMARMTEIELREADFNKFAELARSEVRAASLHEATAGELDRSPRQRELRRPNGFDDELRAALVGESGTWGALTLLRESGSPRFSDADVALVASVSGYLAEGLRRSLLVGALETDGEDDAVGLVVLASDDSVELANPAAEAWLDELGGGETGRLPPIVHAVAARARDVAAGAVGEGAIARARVRTRSGRWLLVRGSLLGEGPPRRASGRDPRGGASARAGTADRGGLRALGA